MAASNVRSDLSKGIKKIMVVFPNIEHKYHTKLKGDLPLQKSDQISAKKDVNGSDDFTDLAYTTSPQHKDSTEACIKRDASDLDTIQTKNSTCSPYIAEPTLRNIVNM
ncbi:hypothetical protein DPMN_073038 [Dreissena polymorpha]|uniref:Uncharacterized protein n=1 Tax=Dreissena polymorpha TaxID=45954 RepID=A0A9D4BYE8_DREPO|nr:hypothetical protein DPMN_073038 [Dreissena polymorpha]